MSNSQIPRIRIAGFTLSLLIYAATSAHALEPGDGVDPGEYDKKLAYRNRNKKTPPFYPWEGKHVVFFTASPNEDPKMMEQFMGRLDEFWELCVEITGRTPLPQSRTRPPSPVTPTVVYQYNGKPVVAVQYSIREYEGFQGNARITHPGEFGASPRPWSDEIKAMKANPNYINVSFLVDAARPFSLMSNHPIHTFAIIQECNFLAFHGHRKMKVKGDLDAERRFAKLMKAEGAYARENIPFQVLLPSGIHQLRGKYRTSDAVSMFTLSYPCFMHVLTEQFSDDFLKRFYHECNQEPYLYSSNAITGDTSICWAICIDTWVAAASFAAKRNLSSLFVKRWRFPVSRGTLRELSRLNFRSTKDHAKALVARVYPKMVQKK